MITVLLKKFLKLIEGTIKRFSRNIENNRKLLKIQVKYQKNLCKGAHFFNVLGKRFTKICGPSLVLLKRFRIGFNPIQD